MPARISACRLSHCSTRIHFSTAKFWLAGWLALSCAFAVVAGCGQEVSRLSGAASGETVSEPPNAAFDSAAESSEKPKGEVAESASSPFSLERPADISLDDARDKAWDDVRGDMLEYPMAVAFFQQHPFPKRVAVPEFPADMEWLNTDGELQLKDLRGKIVLLDFWTYCCINCMHILPKLRQLEEEFPNELVVIGVHSAKFDAEQLTENIRSAILRHDIEHPVVNDKNHEIWRMYGVQSWPTILLIDPEGMAFYAKPGEFNYDEVERTIRRAVNHYRRAGTLDEKPIQFDLITRKQVPTPLRFPGKILTDVPGNRLFIADSNHHRVVVCTLEGQLLETIGAGSRGKADGDFSTCQFNKPQGMVLDGDLLYVADTENHNIRRVDLARKRVTTVAGTGKQAVHPWPGADRLGPLDPVPKRWVGRPRSTALSSPWALWIHDRDLHIAMAGPHQIWKMPLSAREIGPYAGNGREDIIDGLLLPQIPFAERDGAGIPYSAFAQPSGLTSDGQWLYVADSEGSSIRAVPFDATKQVRTILGTSHLPHSRLFTFGDRDGAIPREAQLQHVLEVVYHGGLLYVADTYNNKIKVIDIKKQTCETLAGTGERGTGDAPAQFNEPAGLALAGDRLFVADTNNHLIRVVHLKENNRVSTFTIEGLPAFTPPSQHGPIDWSDAAIVQAEPTKATLRNGAIELQVELQLAPGWKINVDSPQVYAILGAATEAGTALPAEAEIEENAEAVDEIANDVPLVAANVLDRTQEVKPPTATFTVKVPVTGPGETRLRVGAIYYYCEEGDESVCKVGSTVWEIPLTIQTEESPLPVLKSTVVP